MAVRRDIRTRYILEGEGAYKSAVQAIAQEQKTLGVELGKVNDRMRAHGESQKDLRTKSRLLEDQVRLQKDRIAELNDEMAELNAQYPKGGKAVDEHAERIARAERHLQNYQNQLDEVNSKIGITGDTMIATGEKMQRVGRDVSKYVSAPIAAIGGIAIKSSIDFESAFAGVKKTIDATDQEYAQMREGILRMSEEIPASASAIAAVAESAGQLGIERANVLDFSRTIIDLAESTNLGAEAGASMFAQFANITGMDQGDFDRLGSAIVDLGNNGASTEADIMDMSMRLAAAGSQAGMTQADIVGLSASMTDVGINAEAGGTAMSKLITNMQVAAENGEHARQVLDQTGLSIRELQMMQSHNSQAWAEMAESLGMTRDELNKMLQAASGLEGFAKVSGQTSEQFIQSFGTDATGAVSRFVQGLQATEEAGGSVAVTLGDLGITEVRLRDTIMRLTGAGELMNEQVERSNSAWERNSALTNEANQRYETTESQLRMAKNQMENVSITIGDVLAPKLLSAANALADMVGGFAELDEGTQTLLITLGGVAAAAGPLTIALGSVLENAGRISNKFKDLRESGATLSDVLGGNAGKIGIAAAAAVATIAIAKYADSLTEVDQKTQDFIATSERGRQAFNDTFNTIGDQTTVAQRLAEQLVDLADKSEKTAYEQHKIKTLVEQLNSLVPELNLAYDEQTGTLDRSNEALGRVIESQEKRARLDEIASRSLELEEQREDLIRRVGEQQDILNEQVERGNIVWDEANQKYEVNARWYHHLSDPGAVKRLQGMVNTYNALTEEQNLNAKGLEELAELEQEILAEYQQLVKDYEKQRADELEAERQHNEALRLEKEGRQQSEDRMSAYFEEKRREEEEALAAHHDALNAEALRQEEARWEHYERQKADREEWDSYVAEADKQNLEAQKQWSRDYESERDRQLGALQSFADGEVEIEEGKADELRKINEKRIEGFKAYRDNMSDLQGRVSDEMYVALKEMGPTAAGLIAEYNAMTDEELAGHDEIWREVHAAAADAALEEIGQVPTITADQVALAEGRVRDAAGLMHDAGDEYGASLVSGIESQTGNVEDAAGGLAEAAHRGSQLSLNEEGVHGGVTHAQGIASQNPAVLQAASDLARSGKKGARVSLNDSGAYGGTTHAAGIRSKRGDVERAGRDIGTAGRDAAEVSFWGVGSNAAKSFGSGLRAQRAGVESEARGLANAAKLSIESYLQIASPSKVMRRIGAWTGEGMVLGIRSQEDAVERAAVDMMRPLAEADPTAALRDAQVRLRSQVDYGVELAAPTALLESASMMRTAATAQAKQKQLEIDYERFGAETAKAMHGMHVRADGRQIGQVVADQIRQRGAM